MRKEEREGEEEDGIGIKGHSDLHFHPNCEVRVRFPLTSLRIESARTVEKIEQPKEIKKCRDEQKGLDYKRNAGAISLLSCKKLFRLLNYLSYFFWCKTCKLFGATACQICV